MVATAGWCVRSSEPLTHHQPKTFFSLSAENSRHNPGKYRVLTVISPIIESTDEWCVEHSPEAICNILTAQHAWLQSVLASLTIPSQAFGCDANFGVYFDHNHYTQLPIQAKS